MKQKHCIKFLVVASFLLATTYSCKTKKNTAIGTPVNAAVLDTLNLDYANDGKRISFDGYLGFGRMPAFISKTYISVESDNTVKLEVFTDTSYAGGTKLANVNVNFGTGSNSISYPEKDFTDDEVIITSNEKEKLSLFDKVKVSCTVSLDKASKSTTMKVFRTEGALIPAMRNVTQYKMKLTDIRIDKIK
jgi:hypothetical protein